MNANFFRGRSETHSIHPIIEMNNNKNINKGIKSVSLLRNTTTHYVRLVGDADRKARIMIVVNSILLGISVTFLTKTIQTPDIWMSATLLICANLLTLFFSIISVKPELHANMGKEATDYILHYKKCTDKSLEDYTAEMMGVLQDKDKKLEAVIKDLYFFGNLLNRKYKLLKIAYRFFYWGLLVSVLSYLIILLMINR